MIVLIHVDDGLMTASNTKYIDEFMTDINIRFKSTLYNPTQIYLGMEIERKENFIYVHQSLYIKKLLAEHSDVQVEVVPMNSNINLRNEEPNNNNASLLPTLGKLRYPADRTRPDILLALGETSTGGTNNPSDMHVMTAKQIMNYLFTTGDTMLKLGGFLLLLFACCDASYISSGKSLSRLGGCIFLGTESGAIFSFSVNDTTVSHSSCEAEIKSIVKTILAIMHIKDILIFLKLDVPETAIIYVDNKAAIELCKTLKTTHNTKHINLKINFIREKINDRTIKIIFVPSEDNVADVLTKPLSSKLFKKHTEVLMHGHSNPDLFIHRACASMEDDNNNINNNQVDNIEMNTDLRG